VENAYREGAAAVIVYNDRESPTLDKMKLQAKERKFLEFFFSKSRTIYRGEASNEEFHAFVITKQTD